MKIVFVNGTLCTLLVRTILFSLLMLNGACSSKSKEKQTTEGNISKSGPEACGVNPSRTIDQEETRLVESLRERYFGALGSVDSEESEIVIREDFTTATYDLGSFLQQGQYVKTAELTGQTLPIKSNFKSFQFSTQYDSDKLKSNGQSAYAILSGVELGAELANTRQRSIGFNSSIGLKDIQIRQLKDTQAFVESEQGILNSANQLVYAVLEGFVETRISVGADCSALTDAELSAAKGAFSGKADYQLDTKAGINGELIITSKERVHIAYFIRELVDPPPVTNLLASAEKGPQVELSWEFVEGINQYRIFYNNEDPNFNRDTQNTLQAKVSNTNQFTLKQGVTVGDDWYFRVASEVGNGIGKLSAPLHVKIPQEKPTTALTITAVAQATGNIKISWDNPASASTNAYYIYRRSSAEIDWLELKEMRRINEAYAESFRQEVYIDADVVPGQDYDYKIVYANLNGRSPDSNIETVTAVSGTNLPPVVNILATPSVKENSTVDLDASATNDPDSDILTFTWTASDSNDLDIPIQSPNSKVARIVAPEIDVTDLPLTFRLTVSDGVNEVTKEHVITVVDVSDTPEENEPPVVQLNQTTIEVNQGELITFDASKSSDPEGQKLSFTWEQTTNKSIDLGITGAKDASISFNAPFDFEGEEISFTVKVDVFDGVNTVPAIATIKVVNQTPPNEGLILNIGSLRGSVQPGAKDMWTFVVSNTSEFERENIILTVYYPGEFMRRLSSGNFSHAGKCLASCAEEDLSTLTWDIGSLEPGQSQTVRLSPTVDADALAGEMIEINAHVQDDGKSETTATHKIDIHEQPILDVGLSINKAMLMAGEEVRYKLKYGYTQNSSLIENVLVNFNIPNGLIYLSDNNEGQLSTHENDEEKQYVTWNIEQLHTGDLGEIEIVLQVPDDALAGQQYKASATVSHPNVDIGYGSANLVSQVTARRDLEFSLSSSHDPVMTDQPLEIFLKASNLSADDINDLDIWFLFNGTYFKNLSTSLVSHGGTCSGSCDGLEFLTWKDLNLVAGQSIQLMLAPRVQTSLKAGNIAELMVFVDYQGQSYSQKFNTLGIADEAPLEISLSTGETPMTPLSPFSYAINYVFNKPSAEITNTTLELELPANASFVDASHGGISDGYKVTWELGALNPDNFMGSRTVNMISGTGAGEQVQARATIRGDNAISSQGLNIAMADDRPLTVGFSGISSPMITGQMQEIKIIVTNQSAFARSNVSVDFRMQPELTTFGSGVVNYGSCSGSCDTAGETIQYTFEEIPPYSSVHMSLPATIKANATDNILDLSVLVRDDSGIEARARESVIAAPQGQRLSLASDIEPAIEDDNVTLSIAYGNPLDGDLIDSPQILAKLPEGVTISSPSDSGTVDKQTVSWALPPLEPGQAGSRTVSFRIKREPTLKGMALPISATLEDSDATQVGHVARAKALLPIIDQQQLSLNIDSNVNNLVPGDTVTIELRVKNLSGFSRSDVELYLRFPPQFKALGGAAMGGATCSGSCGDTVGEMAKWTFENLPAAEVATITFDLSLKADTEPGSIVPLSAFVTNSNANSAHQVRLLKVNSPAE